MNLAYTYKFIDSAELAFITLVMILEFEVIIIDKTGSCDTIHSRNKVSCKSATHEDDLATHMEEKGQSKEK